MSPNPLVLQCAVSQAHELVIKEVYNMLKKKVGKPTKTEEASLNIWTQKKDIAIRLSLSFTVSWKFICSRCISHNLNRWHYWLMGIHNNCLAASRKTLLSEKLVGWWGMRTVGPHLCHKNGLFWFTSILIGVIKDPWPPQAVIDTCHCLLNENLSMSTSTI